jgi:hypothetical protein
MNYDKVRQDGGWCFSEFAIEGIKDCTKLFAEMSFNLSQTLDSVGKVNKQINSK